MSILITNEEYRQDAYALLNQYKESMTYLASVFNDSYKKSESVTKLPWKSFAFYNKCIKSLQADDAESGLRFFQEARQNERQASESFEISGLSENNRKEEVDLIVDEIREEASGKISIGFISADAVAAEKAKLIAGIELLKVQSIDLYNEAETLIDEIVLTGPGDEYHVRSASSYNLLGLVLIWADDVHSPIYYAQQVVHEAAHLRLFLKSTDDKFVLNPENQLYTAPFRPDARPMLGIFHALFVLARIALAMSGLGKIAPGKLAEEALEKGRVAEKRFFATAAQVKRDGTLTPMGQQIFDECLQEITKISPFRNVYDDMLKSGF
ncbi:aKG-HExxH-type peptide beta-hydroxylase [Pseudomonas avellanae]|uniref:aKG-HExxH-type peptide beta-hydroxylase n=1 Tax=Pseudomonas avellanae TaxID=46257 RepID=UPI0004157903|nr:HEXXH motif-containing putative peptide modification protein [Pseudomonas avellanae]